MPNICDNFVCITGSEEVLCVLEAKDFHWYEYFPDMPENGRTRMGSGRGDDAPPIRLLRNGAGGIQAFFISAWCPPLEFYNRLVEGFGDIRIEYEYHEWRMGFAGFGVAGRGTEPTHFSYECKHDIDLMRRVHSWHLEIQNPYDSDVPAEDDAVSLATHSEDEGDHAPK